MAGLNTFSHCRWQRLLAVLLVAAGVAGCGSKPKTPQPSQQPTVSSTSAAGGSAAVARTRSRWVPVDWSELPGFDSDDTSAAWNAWLQSCERPPSALARLCPQVRKLALASDAERRAWMRANLQPHRVQTTGGERQGLLTGYYEPLFDAARQRQPGFEAPLYAPPAGLRQGARWYTRQQIDQGALLAGRELVWLRDPVDVMIVQIQGSGRVRVREAGGGVRTVRMAFAGTNGQP
ncbi:MAG: MltA domain-containing protein, partial [Ottowia sp.]|nr:MltA domain-containing protein [Ottowia sp.]